MWFSDPALPVPAVTPVTARQLLIVRHAKSAWDTGAESDFERPLAERGKRDAVTVGRRLHEEGLRPDHVVSSPARRARKTARRVCRELGFDKSRVHWDQRIYEGELDDLLAVLADCPPDARRVLLVGHNPGLDNLLRHLWGDATELPEDNNLLPTAAVAQLELPDDWGALVYGAGRLLSLKRPGDPAGA